MNPVTARVNPQRIKDARHAKNWTQDALARAIETGVSNVARWELGKHAPRVEFVAAIAEATGKPIEFFFQADEDDGDSEDDEEAALTDLGRLAAAHSPGRAQAHPQGRCRGRQGVSSLALHPRVKSMAVLWHLKREPQTALEARFLAKLAIAGEGECWIWTASTNGKGYGQFRFNDTTRPAHRVMHDLFYGPEAAEGLDVDHLCSNRLCVHPLHLEAVTHAENVRRAHAGRPKPRRSHCKNGHAMVGENVRPRSDGKGVRCRECSRLACQRYAARRKAGTA